MNKLVLKAFKYRIKDESVNAEFLQYAADAFGQTRFVYNQLHDYIDDQLEKWHRLPSRFDLNNYVNRVLKKQYEWLQGAVDKFYFTHTVYEIHTAYREYLKGNRGKPKFRCKYAPRQTVTTNFTNNNIKVDAGESTISLPYLNKERRLKVILHRPIEGRILGAELTRHVTGDYYVIILCEAEMDDLPQNENHVGIDVGLKVFVTCSDGSSYPSLKALYRQQRRIKRMQRSLSRKYNAAKKKCKEGEKVPRSKNYQKTKAKLARAHEHVANMRSDKAHRISKELIDKNQAIFAEDLNVQGMVKNHCLAKAVSDAAFNSLMRKLAYKAQWHGRVFIKVDRYFPSTQICPHCGYINTGLKGLNGLKIREWDCPHCHAHNVRDEAAAINILHEGMRLWQEGGGLRPRGGNAPKLKSVESSKGSLKQKEAHQL